jgi:hypothetical protein
MIPEKPTDNLLVILCSLIVNQHVLDHGNFLFLRGAGLNAWLMATKGPPLVVSWIPGCGP